MVMAENKIEEVVRAIETLNALELSNLVKTLEEKFGVQAMAPMAAAGPVAGAAGAFSCFGFAVATFFLAGPRTIVMLRPS